MIRLLDTELLPPITTEDEFCRTKIAADLLSYGRGLPFLTHWCQWEGEVCTAIICKMEDTVTLAAARGVNITELAEFLRVIGFDALKGEPQLLTSLGFTPRQEYRILQKKAEGRLPLPEPPPIAELYRLLFSEENEGIKRVDRDGFYADVSHRLRHRTAAALCNEGGAVLVSHLTEDAAVISGIAVLTEQRGRGYGKQLLEEIEACLGLRKIFAAALPDALPFYKNCGYPEVGKTAIYY